MSVGSLGYIFRIFLKPTTKGRKLFESTAPLDLEGPYRQTVELADADNGSDMCAFYASAHVWLKLIVGYYVLTELQNVWY